PLLVFDWDGTLIDSARTIVACIQAACRDLGLTVPDEARASHVIGLGLKDALAYAIPGLPTDDYGRMVESYRKHFLARDNACGTIPPSCRSRPWANPESRTQAHPSIPGR